MSLESNTWIYEQSAEIIGELTAEYVEGVLPKLVEDAYLRLVVAVNEDDMDEMYELNMQMLPYLAMEQY